MTFDWYLLFNLTEFLSSGLVSKTLDIILENIGDAQVIVTRGNLTSIVYEDVMMPIEFNGDNPFIREGTDGTYAVYKDANENVWLGIEVDE